MPFRWREAVIIVGLGVAALLYVWFAERDFALDLFRALFGLSGGTTAGG